MWSPGPPASLSGPSPKIPPALVNLSEWKPCLLPIASCRCHMQISEKQPLGARELVAPQLAVSLI